MSSYKKIAILAPFVGITSRGGETFVIEFTKALRSKYDITVFSYGVSKEIAKETVQIERPTIPLLEIFKSIYQRLESWKGKFFLLSWYAKAQLRYLDLMSIHPITYEQLFFSRKVFSEHIEKGDFDLIFPNNGIWGALFARALRTKKGTPFIYTGHGGIGNEEKKIIKTQPNFYIATNVETEKWARKFSNNVEYIPIGTNIAKFSQKFEIKASHKNLKHPIILCVGAFTEYKRHALLIDAVAKMDTGTLIMLGETGELKDSIVRYCKEKIPGRYMIEKTTYEEIPYYYQLCDVFSLPSEGEAFGIVYLEALAANKPVVAPKDRAREAIIGNAGILCDVTNADEYAKALENAAITDWKDTPLIWVKKNFSWEIIAEKYDALIKSLIK